MGNKTAPAPAPTPASAAIREQLSPASLLNSMKSYVCSKLCYHVNGIKNAKVINMEERAAYQSDLWTLMERRWVKERTKPYSGECIDLQPIGKPWDIDFPKETTILKKKEKQIYDLDKTRCIIVCDQCRGYPRKTCLSCNGVGEKRCTCNSIGNDLYGDERKKCTRCDATGYVRCFICNATGIVNCDYCEARGNLLFWYQVIIEYYTLHSRSFQTNTPLSPDRICKAPGKTIYCSIDKKLSKECVFDDYLQTIVTKKGAQCPVKLDELAKQYKNEHLAKMTPECRVLRVKCDIQKLDVTEVEYETHGFTNKRNTDMHNKFKFYYYGKGKKDEPLIYEDDYPLNTCGCFGAMCAHYSKWCTIS